MVERDATGENEFPMWPAETAEYSVATAAAAARAVVHDCARSDNEFTGNERDKECARERESERPIERRLSGRAVTVRKNGDRTDGRERALRANGREKSNGTGASERGGAGNDGGKCASE